jgi:hypothetical protein
MIYGKAEAGAGLRSHRNMIPLSENVSMIRSYKQIKFNILYYSYQCKI